MKRDKRADLDVKFILKTYWGFLKKYKLLIIAVIIFAFLLRFADFIGRYLFKKVVDNGELFIKNAINLETFAGIITIIAFV